MNSSLRDQLLKAGLVSESKVRQASQADEQRRRQIKNKGKSNPAPAAPTAAQKAQAEKVARDMELNRKQQEKAARRALRAQVEQLVEQARLPRIEGEEPDHYSFVDGGRIRRVAVDAERRAGILQGRLAIVRYRGHCEVVPAEAAQRIAERDPNAVIARDEKAAEPAVAEDDPYKDFVVPDDLTW